MILRFASIALTCLLLTVPASDAQAPAHQCNHGAPGAVQHDHGGHGSDSEEPVEATDDEGAGQEEDSEWDVNAPPLELYDISVDVDEGTWINLDVSPDGREIVFDLFGDLLVMPIEGGDAMVLSEGLAWDMQPRFSPDGSEIAFTSDRSGGDNIWVMPRDGGEARAITKETFRLLNNPVWSPDGRFLAARKHFTARRSLGSGEIWLYHSSGEAPGGLQLNEKPNEQKDLGEPAYSPDGEYVYFSQDTTPGSTFQYNKDSNGQIYTIQRLELDSGEIEPFITGAGGAVRPTPSPDGRYLAFVRRVRFQSVLFLADLKSGEVRPLFDGLERDLQETWAIHGVYPNFAWTPDSESLVFWAGGKIHRLFLGSDVLGEGDARQAELREIPFRVQQTRQLAKVVRSQHEPFEERFHTKMLRWTEISPKGDRAVYQALGKLWIQDLSGGEARRLTTQDDHLELYPSWSRDGRQVVYVSWHDDELGAVRSIDVVSGKSKTVTPKGGHWVEPVISPDGRHVVARKTGGGFVRHGGFSQDPGLYVLSMDGGEPRELTDSGAMPHFADAPGRVYYTTYEDEDRRALRSIQLDGLEPREHANSEAATEWRVSPDGHWLAFVERFHAYVLPFTSAAKPMSLGPTSTGLPQVKVTRQAGEALHWAGDSQALHWSIGPQVFTKSLDDTFAFRGVMPEKTEDDESDDDKEDDDKEDEVEEPIPSVTLGFETEADMPTGSIAIVGAKVVTMRGDEIIDGGVVVVEGNRITAVGVEGEVNIPASATRIDAAGKTVIPGLVDVHWHGSQGTEQIQPQQNWYNYAALAFGVTTVHDPSNDTNTFFAASELAKTGDIVAPRLFTTGTILYGAGGDFKAIIDSLDDARFHLERLKSVGAWSVKSYNQPRRDQRQQVLAAASDLDMLVFPEGGSLYMHNMSMVLDGHTGIEHSIPLANVYDDVLQIWGESGTGYTPTLGVGYGGIWGENYWYAKTDVWANERLLSFVPREFVDRVARRPFMAPDEEYNHISNAKVAKQLSDVGVKVNVGAHGQREGLASHWEMWMFEQGGMTPHEALRAGTWNGAYYLGMEHAIGSIEVGKLADLAIIDGDPLADLRQSENVSHVMINGRLYDASTLDEVAPRQKKRKPFFFESNREPLIKASEL